MLNLIFDQNLRKHIEKKPESNKIVNGQVPDYLTELVPPTVADTIIII